MDSPLLRHELDTMPPPASTSNQNDEELSDQQIYQLLRDAEQGLGSALEGASGISTAQNQSSISSFQKRYSNLHTLYFWPFVRRVKCTLTSFIVYPLDQIVVCPRRTSK